MGLFVVVCSVDTGSVDDLHCLLNHRYPTADCKLGYVAISP